jgi:hypothetical protein
MKDIRELFGSSSDPKWIIFDETDPDVSPAFECLPYDMACVAFQKVRAEVTKPYRKLIAANALSAEKDREIAVRAFVKMCLRNWRNVMDGSDVVPFNEDNAIKYLLELPKLYVWLASAAADDTTFKDAEDAIKN